MALLLEYDGPAVVGVWCDRCDFFTEDRRLALVHASYCDSDELFEWPSCTWPRYPHSWRDDHAV